MSHDPLENEHLNRLRLFFCLLPVVGFVPALWTLYRQPSDRTQQRVSRLAIALTLVWLSSSVMVGAGASSSETLQLPLLLTGTVITSGYFLASFWLMVQVWRRKRPWLPGIGELGDRLP